MHFMYFLVNLKSLKYSRSFLFTTYKQEDNPTSPQKFPCKAQPFYPIYKSGKLIKTLVLNNFNYLLRNLKEKKKINYDGLKENNSFVVDLLGDYYGLC